MNKQEIKKIRALAKGLADGLRGTGAVAAANQHAFIALVKRAESETGDDLTILRSFRPDLEDGYISMSLIGPKIIGLINYLEVLFEEDAVIEIGVLYNSIKDQALRDRCSDILTAKGHFDRVINQATLVLEDRIRKKVGGTKATGVHLINQFVKANPTESPIVVSTDADSQEGFSNICRGVMQALRNPTHHHLIDSFSREEAFHICGFIDRLLKLVDQAEVQRVD
ncbi:MAG TPA: TIGR02391 family protein [Caulobacterales bacterium]|nr:TIGR02391 family protein [Caulobacterales bacterium]